MSDAAPESEENSGASMDEVLARVKALEGQVAELKAQVGQASPSQAQSGEAPDQREVAAAPVAPSPVANPYARGAAAPGPYQQGPGPQVGPTGQPGPMWPTAPVRKPEDALRSRSLGITLVLVIVGGLVTLAGIAMLLVLAARAGLFGPAARVVSAGVLAGLLIGGGLALRSRVESRASNGIRWASEGLVVTGLGVALLDLAAVSMRYEWVSAWLALMVGTLLALAVLAIARTWQSQALAVLAVIGGTLFAVAFTTYSPDSFLERVDVVPFVLVVILAGFAGFVPTGPGWEGLTIVRVLAAGLALVVLSVSPAFGGWRLWVALVAAAGFAALTLATSVRTLRHQPGDHVSSLAAAAAAGLPALPAATLDDPRNTIACIIWALLLGVVATVAGHNKEWGAASSLPAWMGLAAVASATLGLWAGVSYRAQPLASALLALGVALIVGATRRRFGLWAMLLAFTVAGGSLLFIGPFALMDEGERTDGLPLVSGLIAAAMIAAVWWALRRVESVPEGVRTLTDIGLIVAGLFDIMLVLTSAGAMLGSLGGAEETGYLWGQAATTLVWILIGGALLLVALDQAGSELTALGVGGALLAISIAKLFLYDLSSLSGLVRAIAFTITGIALLIIGVLYARQYEKRRRDARAPADGVAEPATASPTQPVA